MRGEEYSAQLDYFVRCIEEGQPADNVNSFASAAMTDKVLAMMIADATKGPSSMQDGDLSAAPKKKKSFFFRGR